MKGENQTAQNIATSCTNLYKKSSYKICEILIGYIERKMMEWGEGQQVKRPLLSEELDKHKR